MPIGGAKFFDEELMKYQLSQLKEKQAKIAARALEEMKLKLVQVAIEVTHEKRALKKLM